ncbi:MAG: GreA/GreB family elongation factor [Thermoguttaceae bacterium]|jgi:transcription elongation GreA/GreB family factor
MAKYLTRFGMAAIRQKIALLEQKRQGALQGAGEAAQNDPNSYHDNFEYEEGMRQQEMFSERLRSLCKLLEGATIAPPPEGNDRVAIGHYVVLRRQEGTGPAADEALVLGGDGEGALFENSCSASSPLGQTLLGMARGETRTVSLPEWSVSVQVLEIRVATGGDLQTAATE